MAPQISSSTKKLYSVTLSVPRKKEDYIVFETQVSAPNPGRAVALAWKMFRAEHKGIRVSKMYVQVGPQFVVEGLNESMRSMHS